MTKDDWMKKGYNHTVAEALAENGKTEDDIKYMGVEDLFDLTLRWNGIIGFTSTITDALDNIRNMEA